MQLHGKTRCADLTASGNVLHSAQVGTKNTYSLRHVIRPSPTAVPTPSCCDVRMLGSC